MLGRRDGVARHARRMGRDVMITGEVILDNYQGWRVRYYLATDSRDAGRITADLKSCGCSDKTLRKAKRLLSSDRCNKGLTVSKRKSRKTFIIASKSTSVYEFINTFVHELDHIEKHIAKALNFDPYSERASYLVGELTREIVTNAINKLLCR